MSGWTDDAGNGWGNAQGVGWIEYSGAGWNNFGDGYDGDRGDGFPYCRERLHLVPEYYDFRAMLIQARVKL